MKKNDLKRLVDEAMTNIRSDREATLEAYEQMKKALDPSDMQTTMLIGGIAVKLLENLNRGTEQVTKLAQILERKESKEKTENRGPVDLDKLKNMLDAEEEEEDENVVASTSKIRVEGV